MQKNTWTKAEGCPSGATCVEVLDTGSKVWVRDSKSTSILSFTYAEWETFLSAVRNGEFSTAEGEK